MTSFRPHVKPAADSARRARRSADFFCRRVVEPARARRTVGTPQTACPLPCFRPMRRAYLRDFFSFAIFIARTFFIIRRNVFLSAVDSVVFVEVLLTHILSDVCQLKSTGQLDYGCSFPVRTLIVEPSTSFKLLRLFPCCRKTESSFSTSSRSLFASSRMVCRSLTTDSTNEATW